MKGKHLLLLLILVGLAGAAGYHFYKDNAAAWSAGGGGAGGKVLDFPINDVARVAIKSAGGELHLVKQGEEWTVQERAGYPAAFEQVSDLIRKLWELKTVQEVKVGPSQFGRLELVEPGQEGATGTVAELQDKDGKKLAALLLGKNHLRQAEGMPGEGGGFPAGRYVAPVGSTKVSLVSETFPNLAGKPESWLRRDFFKIENLKSVKLEGPTEPQRWTVTRENPTAEWTLAGAKPEEKLDPAKVNLIATTFTGGSFVDVLPPDAKPEETGLDKPAVLTFETFDKFTYVLKIGKPTAENQPLTVTVAGDLPAQREPGKDEKPEDKARLDIDFQTTQKRLTDKLTAEKNLPARAYLVSKATLDQVLKDRTSLLVEKQPEPPPAAAAPPAVPPVSATTPPVSAPPVPPPPAPVPPPP